MISLRNSLGRICPWLLAVLIVGLLPGLLPAETVIFRNECRSALVVQMTGVVRGVLKRDQYLVKPGEYTPRVPTDTDRVLTIYDGRSGGVLLRDALRASRQPRGFSIVPNNRLPNRVLLLPRPVRQP